MTQKQALEILKTGMNVFLTGSAGSGKTHLLNQYINYLRDKNIPVAITASTGIAATHMGGTTIHSWAGIGIRDNLTKHDLEMMESKEYLVRRIQNTSVLIIDEISMLDAKRIDMAEWVCRHFKRNEQPFGGMQVILAGDFFQLPPVEKIQNNSWQKNAKGNNDEYSDEGYEEREMQLGFFEEEEDYKNKNMVMYSRAWRTLRPVVCYLSEQWRQEDDKFVEILNAIRADSLKDKHYEMIEKRMNVKFPLGVQPTRLFTHNINVDIINKNHLDKLGGTEKVFQMEASGPLLLVETLKKGCLAPAILRLKIGAEVMFLKNNFEKGYSNGTRGKVYTFLSDSTPVIKLANGVEVNVVPEEWVIEENGKKKAFISQLPLRLAWAITIHKSQGMSLDNAEIDLSQTFAYGMGYVALSRVRTLTGIRLIGFNRKALDVDPKILNFDEDLKNDSAQNEILFLKLKKDEQQKLEKDFIDRASTISKKEKGRRKKRGLAK